MTYNLRERGVQVKFSPLFFPVAIIRNTKRNNRNEAYISSSSPFLAQSNSTQLTAQLDHTFTCQLFFPFVPFTRQPFFPFVRAAAALPPLPPSIAAAESTLVRRYS
jgi:hypothetical protein